MVRPLSVRLTWSTSVQLSLVNNAASVDFVFLAQSIGQLTRSLLSGRTLLEHLGTANSAQMPDATNIECKCCSSDQG
jgi:hypothetical protein